MRAVYIALLLILLATYGPTLYWVKKRSPGLTPLLGWMAGLGFFLIVPLTAITLNGGYKAPQVYEINGWGDVNLSNLSSLEPFIVIWLLIVLACAVVYFCCPMGPQQGSAGWFVPRKKLERSILITMGVGAIGWAAMIYLVGGVEAFLVSHWYNRIEDL